MLKLLIVADDLTGAADTCVQFVASGVPALVVPDMNTSAAHWNAPVVAVNTESRHLNLAEAGRRVASVVERGREVGAQYFYKKVDSTLRGNIGSELEAMMVAAGCKALAFAPAHPRLQRTTRNGFQFVGESPLHATPTALDPLDPVRHSFIPTIIKQQSGMRVEVVSPVERAGWQPDEYDTRVVYVFDAHADDDLRALGELLKRAGLLEAAAGSGGLARHLPCLIDFGNDCGDSQTSSAAARDYPHRMLVVNGSLNPISAAQVKRAQAKGWVVVPLPPAILVPNDGVESMEAATLIDRVLKLYQCETEVVLQSAALDAGSQAYVRFGEQCGLYGSQLHERVTNNTGKLVRAILQRTGIEMLTVFGGDTALAVARACDWSIISPQAELLPGVVLSKVANKERELLLITKAGGFGADDLLLQIKEFFRGTR